MVFKTKAIQMIGRHKKKSGHVAAKFTSILTRAERRKYFGIISSYVIVASLDALSIYMVYSMVSRFQINPSMTSSMKAVVVGLVCLLVFRAGAGIAATFLNAKWSELLLKRLLCETFEFNLSQTYESMKEKSKGEAVRDINQVRFIIDGFTEPVLSIARELFTGVAILVTLLILDPIFAILVFMITGFLGLALTRKLSAISRSFGERRNTDSAAINNITSEIYDGGREIRAHR